MFPTMVLITVTNLLLLGAPPPRPTPQLSFDATWSMFTEGPGYRDPPIGVAASAATNRFAVTETVEGGGTMTMIDDFDANNATWPFVCHCVAQPPSGGPRCFVGPTGVDRGSPPPPPPVYFQAQFFNLFDNITLFTTAAAFAGDGELDNGTRVTWWKASGTTPGLGPIQTSAWAFGVESGLILAVNTNYSGGLPPIPPGVFEHKHIKFTHAKTPPDPAAFKVPAGLQCKSIADSRELEFTCRTAAGGVPGL